MMRKLRNTLPKSFRMWVAGHYRRRVNELNRVNGVSQALVKRFIAKQAFWEGAL